MTDREFIATPGDWPRWPMLPVKKLSSRDKMPETGLIFADLDLQNGHPVVYILNMFHLSTGTVREAKQQAEKKYEYTSIEEMLNDGWVVD